MELAKLIIELIPDRTFGVITYYIWTELSVLLHIIFGQNVRCYYILYLDRTFGVITYYIWTERSVLLHMYILDRTFGVITYYIWTERSVLLHIIFGDIGPRAVREGGWASFYLNIEF